MGYLHAVIDMNAFEKAPSADDVAAAITESIARSGNRNPCRHDGQIVGRTFMSSDESGLSHVLVMSAFPGHWGRGKTLHEAVNAAKWIDAGTEVVVLLCDGDACVNAMGQIEYHAMKWVGNGTLKKRKGKWFVAMEFTAERP